MEDSLLLLHEEPFIPQAIPLSGRLEPIIYTITQSMDVEKIFLSGIYPANPKELGIEYDLMVLTDEKGKRPMYEYESLIANRCHDFSPITVTVHKLATVNQLLERGNIFFSEQCNKEKLVYDSDQTLLKARGSSSQPPTRRGLVEEYRQMLGMAKDFLRGAFNYRESRNNQLAAFMLHQATEQTLNAFLLPLLGFRLQTHNLQKLLLYVRRLSPSVYYDVFPRNTDKEIQLFQVLQKAYIYGRYKNNFLIEEECLQLLMERVIFLQEITPCLFQEKLDSLFGEPGHFIQA